AGGIRRSGIEKATSNDSCGEKIGHLTDRLVGRDHEGAANPEPAVSATITKRHQKLVRQCVKPPIAAPGRGRCPVSDAFKVSELVVIVPTADLVIAKQTCVAWKSVALISGFTNRKHRAVHGHVCAVMGDILKRGIPIVNASHNVGALGRMDLEAAPQVA